MISFRLYNEPCATYETATLRKYQEGRTDTIRSCSIESLEFCKGMCDPNMSAEQKKDLLRKAVNSHKNYVNEVSIKVDGCRKVCSIIIKILYFVNELLWDGIFLTIFK